MIVALLIGFVTTPAAMADDLRDLIRQSQDDDPQERAKAARAMGRLQSMDAAQALFRLLADEHDYVHDEAVEALVSFSDDRVFAFLGDRALAAARDPRTLAGMARVVRELKLTDSVPRLLRTMRSARGPAAVEVIRSLAALGPDDEDVREAIADKVDDREWEVRATALEAHAQLLGDGAVDALQAALEDGDFQVRVAALEALEKVDEAKGLEAAKVLLNDAHWSVRVSSVRVMERSGDHSVISLLSERLRQEDGRLRKDIADCLRSLASGNNGEGGGDSQVVYYGIQIYSKRVYFVTDLSQGMKDKAGGSNKSRIALAQEEYANVLRSYPGDGFFNLVVFATEAEPWQNRMSRASGSAKNQSAGWLDRMVQQWIFGRNTGRTNIYDSLALCFEDPNVDTIVLLTDATSITEGTYRTKTDILRELGELNRYRKIRFHTIGIGKAEGTARSMIKDLAEESRGQSVETD